jgi:ABC-type polysaccharide/polyol phosphate transport system ATPase subunit
MIAIEAHKLSKIYRLYQSPTQRLKEIITRKPCHTQFVALDNINFLIHKGETFGVIGENGAGKSTLLKILARTLKPTNGKLDINGRSAALLELGAGFNPELTGEENIYLNAYLMGLSKADIEENKAHIIDFSELGDFIKRPVKTYSSGMQVRLAFSIATCVNPEILIIDEALSVGDEYFQKKCIDRMMNFKKSGKTILFCSHSMYHVQELCDKAVWLHNGRIKNIGDTGKIITDYQNYEREKASLLKEKVEDLIENQDAAAAAKTVRIVDIKVLDENGAETELLRTFDPVILSFRISCKEKDIKGHIGFALIRNDEEMIFGVMSSFDNLALVDLRDGHEFRIRICSLPILAGIYKFLLIVGDEFALHPYDLQKTKSIQIIHGRKEFGITYIEHEWLTL